MPKDGANLLYVCGIAGILNPDGVQADSGLLLDMAGELQHRGPDGTSLLLSGNFGMVNTRLAIIDIAGGVQPLATEDGRFQVMQNGEIFNHVELRAELEAMGHVFRTRSDTEVIAHAWEEWGPGCLPRLNGEFAIAVWDTRARELFLARDRFGVRPLFLARSGGALAFASECRALLRHPLVSRQLDPAALQDAVTLWGTLPGTSAFRDVQEVPGGWWLRAGADGIQEQQWWDISFTGDAEASAEELAHELHGLLSDAVSIRMRADVPVGAYVSGGLDSSAIVALLKEAGTPVSKGFAIGFEDRAFDETAEQEHLAAAMGVDLERITVTDRQIAEDFPRVVSLSERPMLRTAPGPLLRLSALARQHDYKVVLTGEGADELFGGYSIFKEAAVRRFWARQPDSTLRPQLLRRLHPYATQDLTRGGAMLQNYYGTGLLETDDPLYSHQNRFRNGHRNASFLAAAAGDSSDRLRRMLPPDFSSMDHLGQAQYVEIATFMRGYLLHSQGDRMLMASGVEGRFPYLDHRVAEFAARLPARLRLNGLQEKYLLRKAVSGLLPDSVAGRQKRPYRAPLLRPFLSEGAPGYVRAMLDPGHIAAVGIFRPDMTASLIAKATRRLAQGNNESDEMALIFVLSTMLLHDSMIAAPTLAARAVPDRVVDLNVVPA